MIQRGGIQLSFDQNVPIYLQLVEKIRFRIISGELSPGERVLSVREWALQERVNPNTMQKALSELEDEGLIVTERTNGKFVTDDLEAISQCKKDEAERLAAEFLEKMNQIGFDADEVMQYIAYLKGE